MIRKLVSSQFRRNISSGMLTNGIGFVVTMVSYPVYLHFLGYETYGVWLVLAAVLSLAQMGNLGIGPAVSKFVAEYQASGDTESVSRYVTTALYTLGITGTAVFLLILGLRAQLISLFKLGTENSALASALLPYVGILSLYIFIVRTMGAVLSGMGRIDILNYSSVISKVIAVALSTVLLYSGYGIASFLIASFASEFLAHVFYAVMIRRLIRISYWHIGYFDRLCLRKMLGLGSSLMGGTVLNMLVSPFNKMMISRYIGVGYVPLYEIAYGSAMYLRDLLASGLVALMPEVSRLSAAGKFDIGRIRHLHHQSMRLILVLGTPLFFAVFALATPLLEIWLQKRFNPLLPDVFRTMLIGSFLSLLGVPSFYTIMGLGRSGKIFLTYAIQSGVNILVVLAIVFSGSLSVNGVISGIMLGMGLSTLYLAWQYRFSLDEFKAGRSGMGKYI